MAVLRRYLASSSDGSRHSAYFNRPSFFSVPGINLSAPVSIQPPNWQNAFYALDKTQPYQGLVRLNGSGVEVPMWFDRLLESSFHLHYEDLLGPGACRSGPNSLILNSANLCEIGGVARRGKRE